MEKIYIEKKNILKFLLLVIFGVIMLGIALKYGSWVTENAKEPQKVREYLRSFGNVGFIVYVLTQSVHVLTVVIPGDVFNICGGYIYGIPLGFILSFIGIMFGSVMAFYISRFLGYDFISKFIPEEKIKKVSQVINSTQGMIGMFIICMIPFIPKDLMMYIAGLTPIRASKLFFVYALSRIPGTLIWVSVGANMYEKSTKSMIITIVGLVLLLIVSFILKIKYKTCETRK
ncbi:MAG: VTT domain-containing protein [Lachnospiraceae bacterium]|nr:VTT domain-containing protein [Lachnospiraceae bacterium]